MTEAPFIHRLRVRYCETDRQGVAHHGSYIDWFEEARTEWLRARGKSYADMEAEGSFLQVVEVKVRYRKPTTYDDEIEIEVACRERKRVSVTLGYTVRHAGEVVAEGETMLACVDGDGKLSRLTLP